MLIVFVYLFVIGELCIIKGCPGDGVSCSGRGSCNIGDQRCTCDNLWKGVGCEEPDCPGTPDCNGRGMINYSHQAAVFISTLYLFKFYLYPIKLQNIRIAVSSQLLMLMSWF